MNFVCLRILKHFIMKSIFAAHVILTMSGFQHLYHSTSNGLSFDILRLQYTFYSTHEICTYVTLVCTVKNVLQMTVHLMCYDINAESRTSYKFLAYLEGIRSYAWSFGYSDPDLSSVRSKRHT